MDAAPPPPIVIESDTQARPPASPIEPDEAPRAHAVDLGIATFLRSGIASSGVTGISPFVAAELGRDVFVRLAASVGQAPANGLHLTWLAGRLDTCSEMAGNYAAGSGLRFDLCGGADVGATFIPSSAGSGPLQTLPFVDIGPSFDLRAELGESAAILLRAGAGISIARDSFMDASGESFQPPLLSLDVEIALSWTVPARELRAPHTASAK
jgi:hypothetical protein